MLGPAPGRQSRNKLVNLLRSHAKTFPIHLPSVILGIALILAGVVYKKAFSPIRAGFPEYFTFLVLRTGLLLSLRIHSTIKFRIGSIKSKQNYPFGPFQRAGSDAKTQAQDTTMSAGGRADCESLVIISEERVDKDKDNRIVAAVA
jgi:hypothetical protein